MAQKNKDYYGQRLYNIKIYNSLTKKVNELGGELKEPEKIFQDYKKVVSAPKTKLGTKQKTCKQAWTKYKKL